MSQALALAASVTTLFGIWQGTTTRAGARWYAAAMPFWWGLVIHDKILGLIPLNAVMTVVAVRNLLKTWKA